MLTQSRQVHKDIPELHTLRLCVSESPDNLNCLDMSMQDTRSGDTTDDLVYQFATAPSGWYAARASGLYRSDDGGASWQLAYESLGAESALATLAVATATGQDQSPLVFAGLSGELLRSADGGNSWELAPKPSP